MGSYQRDCYLREAEGLRNSKALPLPEEFYEHAERLKEIFSYGYESPLDIPKEVRGIMSNPLTVAWSFINEKIDAIYCAESCARIEESTILTAEDLDMIIN